MKHSMFLFFFFFTFSTSTRFNINMIPGLHIWEVPKEWKENPTYEIFDLPNDESSISNSDISELDNPDLELPNSYNSNFGIPNSGIRELGILEQSTPKLDTHNTYIILVIDSSCNFFLYYWIGAESSERKRMNVAHLVGLLLVNEIYNKMPESNLRIFYREVEGAEDRHFIKIFKLPKPKYHAKLYRIAGTRGQFIMKVPPVFSELNGSDSFVLDQFYRILIWNPLGSNEYKENKATALGRRIIEIDRQWKPSSRNFFFVTQRALPTQKQPSKNFRHQFLHSIEGAPKPRYFPNINVNYTDREMENKKNANPQLYEYISISEDVTVRVISSRPLKLNLLETKNTYILFDSYDGNLFVFLGRKANVKQVQKSLCDAEKFSKSKEMKHSWGRVNIFREGFKFPTYFLIYFSDVIN